MLGRLSEVFPFSTASHSFILATAALVLNPPRILLLAPVAGIISFIILSQHYHSSHIDADITLW